MTATLTQASLEIRESPGKGRGVFAKAPISAGESIEIAPVIPFGSHEWPLMTGLALDDYTYCWGKDAQGVAGAFALGYGSLYNHDYSPNAYYVRHLAERVVQFIARRDIQPGEEITINYNGDPDCQDPVWFDSTKNLT